MRSLFPAVAAFLALLPGCGAERDRGGRPLVVSLIGAPPRGDPDPNRTALTPAEAGLLGAIAQGLVRFDAAGQIEPGLAVRWDVSDDGLFYTFRLRGGIDAARAARRLRAAIAPTSRNRLRPILLAIDEIVAVTPDVLELRLTAPRPNLLQLLAQPELAIRNVTGGGGPMQVAGTIDGAFRLVPVPEPNAGGPPPPPATVEVRVRGERAALAVARFKAGAAQVVTGGTFADLAVARAAAPERRVLRFDPAPGVVGFEIVRAAGFLAEPDRRRALSAAIDRARIVAAFADEGWRASAALVPGGTELPVPAAPAWLRLPSAERYAQAAAAVAAAASDGAPPRLRVAMPQGPGARLLFALVAADWRAIGIEAEAVPLDAPADLRLVDEVAPGDVATWYLRRFACMRAAVCSVAADTALEAARTARSIPERLRRLLEANLALEETVPFIPLATPLRWSLVAPSVPGWANNARAVHPLYALRRRD